MTDDTYPPVISTPYGNVTEAARAQAELNIARDPELKMRLIAQYGEAQIRRNYPRAFEEDDATQA